MPVSEKFFRLPYTYVPLVFSEGSARGAFQKMFEARLAKPDFLCHLGNGQLGPACVAHDF